MSTKDAGSRPTLALLKALIPILIVGTALAIAVPALLKARQAAAEQATKDNLATVAKAVHAAHTDHGKLPPYFGPYGIKQTPLTFHAHLLPYLGLKEVHDAEPINGQAIVPAFLSSMDPTQINWGTGAANYPVNLRLFYTNGGMGELGKHPKLVQLRFDVIINGDGVQNTLLLATKYHTCGANGGSLWFDPGKNEIASLFAATFGANMNLWQNAPTEAACDPTAGTAVGLLPDTIHVALCDASCRTVKVQMDKYAWQSAHTYSGRGELPFHWDE